MRPTSAHRWEPVEELPPDLQQRQSSSLAGLAQAWREEREAMRELQIEPVFLDRWKNRLAVETGIIEGLYPLSTGITETLIEQGFDAALLPNSEVDGDRTTPLDDTGTSTSTARNTALPRWTVWSSCTVATSPPASAPMCWRPGCTTGSRRSTRSRTVTAGWPDDEFDQLAVELQEMIGVELRALRDQLCAVLATRSVDGRVWVDVDTAETAMWYPANGSISLGSSATSPTSDGTTTGDG